MAKRGGGGGRGKARGKAAELEVEEVESAPTPEAGIETWMVLVSFFFLLSALGLLWWKHIDEYGVGPF